MKFKNFYLPALISACMLPSCVDDKYDLSDIDTTVRVDVKDLTIPLNLDEILLSNIIDESEQLKIENGQYVITENGEFSSSSVEIDGFTITNKEEFNPTRNTFPFDPAAIPALGEKFTYSITPEDNHFNFTAEDIPAEIKAIYDISGDLQFTFLFSLPGLSKIASKAEIHDMVIQLPKGLTLKHIEGGSYDATDGLLSLPEQTITNDELKLIIEATKLNFKELGAELDYATHSIDISGDFYVKTATLVVNTADILSSATATNIELTIDYSISDFPLTAVSGVIQYDITDVEISDVSLDNLPDVLSQEGTNIMLANPQIYLNINSHADNADNDPNPLEQYKLYAETGLTIKSVLGPEAELVNSANDFKIGFPKKDEAGIFSICLSPSNPTNKPSDYTNAEWVEFTGLSDVISNGENEGYKGYGMPKTLKISLDKPEIPDQEVTDFRLGEKIGDISGTYDFYAPVALKKGAKIIYSDTMDGWDTEDMEDLIITDLHIAATITTDIPLSLDFKAYPVDKDGHHIGNVEIEGAELNASSEPQEVDIHITGEIKGIAGVEFTATAIAADDNVLRPDMTIKVAKLRPRVSGYYEKEL